MPGLLLLLEPWGAPIPRQRPCRRGRLRALRRGGWCRGRRTGEDTTQRRRNPLEIPWECVAQITEQVKAISHLDGFWRTPWRPARIVRGAITGHDFHAWVRTQPGRPGVGGALGQQLDRPLWPEIDQDGARDPALAERKIVDPQEPGYGPGRRRGPLQDPEDGVATHRYPQARRHACASWASGLVAADPARRRQPHRPLGTDRRQRREALRKRAAWTGGWRTTETPDMHAEVHGLLDDGQSAPLACIAARPAG
jgi:hypothetical protein